MKKKKTAAPATAQPEKKKRKQSKLLQRILAAVLTLLLIVLAVLVFVFREQLSNENLRETIYGPDPFETEGEAFAYESGSDQVFAAAGNGLAVASGSAVQLLSSDGETVWKQIVSSTSVMADTHLLSLSLAVQISMTAQSICSNLKILSKGIMKKKLSAS